MLLLYSQPSYLPGTHNVEQVSGSPPLMLLLLPSYSQPGLSTGTHNASWSTGFPQSHLKYIALDAVGTHLNSHAISLLSCHLSPLMRSFSQTHRHPFPPFKIHCPGLQAHARPSSAWRGYLIHGYFHVAICSTALLAYYSNGCFTTFDPTPRAHKAR